MQSMPYGSLDYRKFVCESQGHNSRDEKVVGLDKVTCFLIIFQEERSDIVAYRAAISNQKGMSYRSLYQKKVS